MIFWILQSYQENKKSISLVLKYLQTIRDDISYIWDNISNQIDKNVQNIIRTFLYFKNLLLLTFHYFIITIIFLNKIHNKHLQSVWLYRVCNRDLHNAMSSINSSG